MAELEYEYRSAYINELDALYAKGWEPVPNVPVIQFHGLASGPSSYLQLRRPLASASSWAQWRRRVKQNQSEAK